MNRILLALNAVLFAAVLFLFFKVFALGDEKAIENKQGEKATETVTHTETEPVKQVASTPTGKIAYVNIDKLNEQSLEIIDLVAETKRRRGNIESSLEALSNQYQKKVEEFQTSQKAGIAPESELRAKAKEIENIEKEAQNKQIQMDNLSMDINDKNNNFQKNVRDFLLKWNNGRYDYILSYSEAVPTMLLGNTTLEITDEVVGKLNEEYKQRKKRK
jgi:outer membrane protein